MKTLVTVMLNANPLILVRFTKFSRFVGNYKYGVYWRGTWYCLTDDRKEANATMCDLLNGRS